jgi:MFS family permease
MAVATLKRLRGSGGTFASLHGHRNYRLYFAGQIVSYCGSVMQDTALPWLVYERTHSPFLVGLLVFCRYGPFSVLGPQGGVLADRHDNRRILVATQTSAMAVASLLTVVAFVGAAPLWTIFALASCSGIILAFDTPSKYSLIYQLVSRDELPNAVALSYTLQNTARIIGPAIGGVLIAGFGAGWCFLINAASFVATLVALLLMRREEFFEISRSDEHLSAFGALRQGLSYARRSRYILTLMGLAVVGGLFGFSAMRTLLPVLAAQTLHGGARVFGGIYACYGLGAVVGSLVNATYGGVSWRRVIISAATFNIAILLLAPVRSTILAGILLVVIGGAWTMWSSQAQTSVQLAAPDRLRGRLISLYVTALLLGAPVGGLFGGWLAGAGGTTLALSVAGGTGIVACAVAAALQRTAIVIAKPDAPELVADRPSTVALESVAEEA